MMDSIVTRISDVQEDFFRLHGRQATHLSLSLDSHTELSEAAAFMAKKGVLGKSLIKEYCGMRVLVYPCAPPKSFTLARAGMN